MRQSRAEREQWAAHILLTMRGLSAVAAVFVISCLLSFTSAGTFSRSSYYVEWDIFRYGWINILFTFSGIAKRDTIVDDIKDSIGDALDDALGKEKTLMEEIEDFKIEDLDVRQATAHYFPFPTFAVISENKVLHPVQQLPRAAAVLWRVRVQGGLWLVDARSHDYNARLWLVQVYGTCKFHAWFWIAVGVGICATFGSCLTTLLCCLCKCR